METALSILAIVAGIALVVALAILILRIVDRFTLGPSLTPEERALSEQQFRERLMRPLWSELEDHFGFAMPRSLRELYADGARLGSTSFYVVPPVSTSQDEHHFIARFEPADVQTLEETWFPIGEQRFPFASDGFGNYFYVELSPGSQDARVLFVDHDGGNVSLVSDSLADFLRWKTYPESERVS